MAERMMKAAVLHASKDIRYEDYPAPEMKPGHVRVHVRACGICGSDVPRVLGNAAHFFPIVLGHEFSGEIVELAEDVKGFALGQRVVCASLIPCGQCPDCQLGHFSLCKHYTFIGSRIQGGMADEVVVPAANVIPFSPNRSFEEAALIEPASVALHGVLLNNFKGGGRVAVVGAGTIGIFVAQWARLLGAASVAFFDVDDDRLALAKEITGFEGVNTLKTDAAKAALALTGGAGFGDVFGVSGAPGSYHTCFAITANKAHLCFVGTPSGEITFSAAEWELINRRELSVTGSWMSYTAPFPGRAWSMCAEYLDNGRLKCDGSMVHRVFPMEKCAEAFACYEHPEQVKGRILLVNR
ncbi:MAG: galactitol-1-phosphate 5-dehydrogenase [Eubacteriales bacterium]|nr:galactitol-1-phosphate 5-dehydrogenase [Eubacteriales bacterium]